MAGIYSDCSTREIITAPMVGGVAFWLASFGA